MGDDGATQLTHDDSWATEQIEAGLLSVMQCRPRWREMGLRGRRYAIENLQWKNIASNVLEQYARLTG